MSIVNKRNIIFANKLLVIFSFIVIAFMIYAGTMSAPFQYDDYYNIVDNPQVTINELSISSLKGAANSEVSGFRPVSYVSLALNHYMSGTDTTSYHVVNVLIHIINAFLIYLIILRMFGDDSADDESKERLAVSAFFTALIWLVTPLNSQAVIFIVQRMTSLMALFFLLSFYCYIIGRRNKATVFLLLSGLFYILSVLSKQNGITLPFVIMLYELIFVRKGDPKNLSRKEYTVLGALIFMVLILLIVYKSEVYTALFTAYKNRDFTMGERVLTQFRMIVFYLSLIVLPLPGRLSIKHEIVKSTSLFSPVTTIISIILVLVFFIFGIRSIKKSPYLSFAILFFFITISVESSVIGLEMAYEHRIYLPCVFLIFIAIDFAARKLLQTKREILIGALLCVSLLFGAMTAVRGKAWKSEYTLWSDVLKKYPRSERAYNNLGITYLEARDYQSAERHFLKAIEYGDDWTEPYYNLGKVYADMKMYTNAIETFNKGLKVDPESVMNLYGLGLAYFSLQDYANSVKFFKMSNAATGDNDKMYYESLNSLGAAYLAAGQNIEAERAFRALAVKYPSSGMYRYNLAITLKNQKKYKAAGKEFSVAFTTGYNTIDAAVEAVRSMLGMNDTPGAERFINNYKGFFEKYCIRDFLRGMISEKKGDAATARNLYGTYITCEGSSGSSPYVKEAKKKLNNQ